MNEGDAVEAAIASAAVVFSCFTIYISFTFAYLVSCIFYWQQADPFSSLRRHGTVFGCCNLYDLGCGCMDPKPFCDHRRDSNGL